MRTLYSWRGRAEPYLLVPLVALVVLQGAQVVDTATPGYWAAAVAKANLMLFIVVPICAVSAAWEGSRHRGGRIETLAVARPVWQVVLVALAPTVALGLVGITAALAATAPAAQGAPGHPYPWLILVYVLVLVGHTVVGYGLGRWLPPALALPAGLAGSYVWLAYPGAIEPLWIRHLNGLSFEGCCAIDQAPAVRAMLATGLFAVGLVVGTLIALLDTRRTRIAGAATFAALLGLAVTAALPLGASSGAPRPGAPRCTDADPVLCLWPEQERVRPVVHPALSSAYDRLVAVGLPLPTVVTAADVTRPDAVFVALPPGAVGRDAVLSLVSSLVPDTVPDCALRGEWPGADSRAALAVWMALVAGVPAAELGAPPELVDLGIRVRRLDDGQQLAWYRANLPPLADCTTRPRLDPAAFRAGAG
ncbi:DUF7224 domain-containing protein [Micromonospora sp. SH-82]|uniref:DUF7224 domain-containing protein n=1 Tax=Micromonospora sp. SH-82 TaxID=3132938 RepID=UPI003EC0A741